MKRLFLFILPTWIWAQSYPEVISVLDHSLMLQSAQQLEIAAYESYKAAEGKNLPTLDASLSAIKFQDTPTVTFGSMKLPMGTKNHTEGSLTLTYPLFSGFAISSSIEKAKFSHEKAALEVADLKRNLYVNATKLYSAVAVADEIIAAQEEAKYAIGESYAKAKGLYDNGMLAPAELYAIEAKKFEIDAQITESRNRKSQALNQLSYLTGVKIDSAHIPENTLSIPDENDILARALAEREDVLALSKSMDIAQSDVKISKSRYYPTVALIGSLKGQGDSLEFDGDGYTNGNKSYAGVSASWNLFSGFSDIHTTEAAKAARLASSITLEDYKHRISTEIENAYLDMHATQSKLESARMQVKASGEYAKLTRGRFENQLVGADELSRSIADLASAKAKAANLESELFNQTAVLWLEGGLNAFQDKVIGTFRNTP
ncbi:TolC family protein [Sulfuricurvum sp.]|uniref:TolC family protein n=1 Tax=Sulfuricurvum sp. TaxID=2025608 RepID=UPI0026161942|nr:TolC family protein [Sulfuricurvum sp.]MDD2267119.1 TolC family protein [Sulfuricurvum sp.]MDD2785009.1 TolC family protein [Sulfuricurvum sp.]